jgi:hypothetical protein
VLWVVAPPWWRCRRQLVGCAAQAGRRERSGSRPSRDGCGPRCQGDGPSAPPRRRALTLLDAGETITALAEYLGHSAPGFTLKVYTHLMPSSKQRTRKAVDGVFGHDYDQSAAQQTSTTRGDAPWRLTTKYSRQSAASSSRRPTWSGRLQVWCRCVRAGKGSKRLPWSARADRFDANSRGSWHPTRSGMECDVSSSKHAHCWTSGTSSCIRSSCTPSMKTTSDTTSGFGTREVVPRARCRPWMSSHNWPSA